MTKPMLFVAVSQNILDATRTRPSLADVVTVAQSMARLNEIDFLNEPVKAKWGSAVYVVSSDGVMLAVDSNLDTSG